MIRARTVLLLSVLYATGCATPQEVKRATVALDEGYRNNLETVEKYRDTIQSIKRLHYNWARYIKGRLLLSLAVDWATLDPPPSENEAVMKATHEQLGDDIVAWVNKNRLAGLRPHGPLAAGTAKLDRLVHALPALANLVRKKVDADLASDKDIQSLASFDKYANRVALLRSANAAVRDYLAVDITVSKEDVKEIADSIKHLRSGK